LTLLHYYYKCGILTGDMGSDKKNVGGELIMFTSITGNLDTKTLGEIKTLEKELDCPVLAFSFFDVEPASLDEKGLARIKKFEEGKCICLLAVKP